MPEHSEIEQYLDLFDSRVSDISRAIDEDKQAFDTLPDISLMKGVETVEDVNGNNEEI